MGGFGSGSLRRSFSITSEELLSLSVQEMSRAGWFGNLGGVEGPVEIEIAAVRPSEYQGRLWRGTRTGYGHETRPESVPRANWLSDTSLFVALTATRPQLGGVRYWLICPRTACRRRCGILFREPNTNARAFACRQCYRVRYRTQRMGKADLIAARVDRLVSRLDVGENGSLLKPRWMRRATYDRIEAEATRLIERWKAADPTYRHIGGLICELEAEMRSSGCAI